MPLSAINHPYFQSDLDRYEQGDILRDITVVEWADLEGDTALNIVKRTIQYCVIVTQECDLEHDFKNRTKADSPTTDKYLQSLLICPAYPSQSFKTGEHLVGVSMKMQQMNSDRWGQVKNNNNARYHYLQSFQDLQVPELVVDFKHYVTIPREIIYRDNFFKCYIASMEILFRDSLSNRFAHYLSRIGLPEFAAA